MSMESVLIFVALAYIASAVTLILFGWKKDKALPRGKTGVTIVRPIDPPDVSNSASVDNKSRRVIPLTDEYEYEQSKKFKNLSDR
jgi:hypothetical protein